MRRALLLNWLDLDPGAEREFDLWHNREHVADRLALPGFLSCRRYASVETPPAQGFGMLILYEAGDVTAFASNAYNASLNAPTSSTSTVIPRLRRVTRAILEVERSWRVGLGGWLATMTIPSLPGRPAASPDLTPAHGVPSITAMTFACRAPVADAKIGSREERVTDTGPADVDSCILIEASRPEGLIEGIEALYRSTGGQPPTFHRFCLSFAAGA